jgi:hypothetical protein
MLPDDRVATVAELLGEDVISLAAAARLLKVSPGRVRSWAKHGKGGVRLEVIPVGRRLKTSREAIARFLVAVERATREVSYPMPRRRRG